MISGFFQYFLLEYFTHINHDFFVIIIDLDYSRQDEKSKEYKSKDQNLLKIGFELFFSLKKIQLLL